VFPVTLLRCGPVLALVAVLGCRSAGTASRDGNTEATIESGLVLAYDFETVIPVANAAPGGLPGTVHGATPVKGRQGMGLHFDGDDWVDTGLSQTVEHRAFAFWIQADAVPQKDVIPFGTMHDESRLYLGYPPEENTIGLGIGPVSYYGKGVSFVQDTLWHHVVLNRAEGEARLYVDGKRLQAIPDGTVAAAGVYYVGAINKAHLGQAMLHFKGTIDSVRIWNRPLNVLEIASLAL